ncbi:MAG: Spy/CpxP family protein refolding chaperone [Ramlibacter sp.]
MKRSLAILATVAALSVAAYSQPAGAPPPQGGRGGWSMGPGMMAGQGYGWGMGPGMMGQGQGWGMGMGMGPGMMGHGWGMSGPARAWRYPADLTQDQREKITQIQTESWKQRYALMQQMHLLMWNEGAATDDQAAQKNYEAGAALQKQMIDNATDTQKRIEGVLTPKQREELRRGPY